MNARPKHRPMETAYRGRRTPQGCVIERRDPSTADRTRWTRLSIAPSLRVISHSPTGFEWGYAGSGPAQTALAILLDFYQDEAVAVMFHQQLKFRRVQSWPQGEDFHKMARGAMYSWTLTAEELVSDVAGFRAESRIVETEER